MSDIIPLIPGRPAPDLAVPLVSGRRWLLRERSPETFTVLHVYRGLHCPICLKTLKEWESRADDLEQRGLDVLCLSSDDEDAAKETVETCGIERLAVGWGFELAEARRWGLYASSGVNDKEPERFLEPGLFLIEPDHTIYSAQIQTMPFARPRLDDLLDSIDFIMREDYPPRGEIERVSD